MHALSCEMHFFQMPPCGTKELQVDMLRRYLPQLSALAGLLDKHHKRLNFSGDFSGFE
jgi:hypothetical protein